MMKQLLQHPWFTKVLIGLILALIFMAYLRPEMMVDVANTILTLCGW